MPRKNRRIKERIKPLKIDNRVKIIGRKPKHKERFDGVSPGELVAVGSGAVDSNLDRMNKVAAKLHSLSTDGVAPRLRDLPYGFRKEISDVFDKYRQAVKYAMLEHNLGGYPRAEDNIVKEKNKSVSTADKKRPWTETSYLLLKLYAKDEKLFRKGKPCPIRIAKEINRDVGEVRERLEKLEGVK